MSANRVRAPTLFRGHDNVQGATDIGLDIVTLPFYYGLSGRCVETLGTRVGSRLRLSALPLRFQEDDGNPRHSADALVRRRSPAQGSGRAKGQRAGHVRTRTRQQQHHAHPGIDESVTEAGPAGRRRPASDYLGLACGAGAGRKDNMYLLPVCTQFETSGSRVASNRSLQWGEPIVPPSFEVQGRLSGHLSDGEEAWVRGPDVQEHQGRRRPAGARGHPARDESRKLEHRATPASRRSG